MLILLPIAAFLLLFIVGIGHGHARGPNAADLREPFVLASIGCGSIVALVAEGLSLFGWIGKWPVATAWTIVGLLLLLLAARWDSFRTATLQLRNLDWRIGMWESGMLAGLLILVTVLLAVAWIAPPNNVDSLLYHMSRVMHWTQNGSLDHYATGYHHQLTMPPWAEMAILHLRILWGSDRPANLVQWSSMLGSLVVVSGIASNLGAGRKGQILASVFAATLPMGVLQATSTQNDYAVALWLVCCAYIVTLSFHRSLSRVELIGLGLAIGLGILTKVTFYVYVLPLAVAFFLGLLQRRGLQYAAATGTGLALLVVALNLGTWTRNFTTYGGPYGTIEWMSTKLAPVQLLAGGGVEPNPSVDAGEFKKEFQLEEDVVQPIGRVALWPVARVAQAAALNFVTPSSAVNNLAWRFLDSLPSLFNGVVSHSLTLAAWSHEDTAGNPIHLFIIVLSLVMLPLGNRRNESRNRLIAFAFLAALAFVLLPLIVKRATSGFGIRYQLPFFVLWAPVVGAAIGNFRLPTGTFGLGVFLMLTAVPYVLFNNTRPVIGRPPWPTRIRSVFQASREEIMFAANPGVLDQFEEMVETIERSGCRELGLRLDSGDLEYQIWWLLDAPQSGYRLESVYTYPSLEHLLDPEFKPCAIVCTICGEREELDGLVVSEDYGYLRLFVPRRTGQ